MIKDENFVCKLFETQGPNSPEHRKDLSHYSQFMEVFGVFYNEIFENDGIDYLNDLYENVKKEEVNEVCDALISFFERKKQGSEETLKNVADSLKYTNKKKYEKDPDSYRGVIFQFYHFLRIALTHTTSGIGMDEIISSLGYDEVINRLNKIKED